MNIDYKRLCWITERWKTQPLEGAMYGQNARRKNFFKRVTSYAGLADAIRKGASKVMEKVISWCTSAAAIRWIDFSISPY